MRGTADGYRIIEHFGNLLPIVIRKRSLQFFGEIFCLIAFAHGQPSASVFGVVEGDDPKPLASDVSEPHLATPDGFTNVLINI